MDAWDVAWQDHNPEIVKKNQEKAGVRPRQTRGHVLRMEPGHIPEVAFRPRGNLCFWRMSPMLKYLKPAFLLMTSRGPLHWLQKELYRNLWENDPTSHWFQAQTINYGITHWFVDCGFEALILDFGRRHLVVLETVEKRAPRVNLTKPDDRDLVANASDSWLAWLARLD